LLVTANGTYRAQVVISPVIATALRTGTSFSVEIMPTAMAAPADGPYLECG
jgi:hypothetical protein